MEFQYLPDGRINFVLDRRTASLVVHAALDSASEFALQSKRANTDEMFKTLEDSANRLDAFANDLDDLLHNKTLGATE